MSKGAVSADGAVSKGKVRSALLGVALLLLAVPLGVWLARGTIATSLARGELERRGLVCDDRFAVSLSASLGEATLSPTRCTHEGGVVESIELLGDVTVEVDLLGGGVEPRSVRAESLRLGLRDTDVRGGSSWAAPLRQLALEQRVAGMLKGLSELSAMELPSMGVTEVEVVRGGEALATATSLRLTPGESLELAAQRIHFAHGVGALDLSNVHGTAGASAVDLEGEARARAGIGILSVERRAPFSLRARGLDTGRPSFSLDGF